MPSGKEIAFGSFRLDLTNEWLWEGTRSITLRPKAFAVLKLLLDHPGQLVNKEELLDAVWPGTFVGDAVLKSSIRQLREALDDDAKHPSYIETAHRRGYRFIGRVSESTTSEFLSTSARLSAAIAPFAMGTVLGRDAELLAMRGWLDRAVAGERQTVFVTGEPGIGKTSVVEAFLKQAEQIPGMRVVRGQCLEHYGSGEAYLPLLDGFSRLCRCPGGGEVLELLRNRAPAWLAQMPSLIVAPERDTLQSNAVRATRERMLREMADAVEELTSESPLVLFLEDLHWTDYSTLDLISYLARRPGSARLMVVGTYRPVDVILSDHPLRGVKRELQAHGLCHELALEYFSEEVVSQYLELRFPSHQLPSRLRRLIYKRTDGNPLFMVNLVQYLIDRKMIDEEQGTWKLRVELSVVERGVPASLRGLIEKQLERLSPDERTVLEGASVVGMECSSAAIAAGLDMPCERVEAQCEQLARRHRFLSPGWLVHLPDGTVTSRYRFVHVLYLEVPYSLVPGVRRSQIHHRIAEAGVAIYGDCVSEIAAELAMHFERSHDWPRALKYLLQAAETASSRSAHHETADLATRGLDVLKSLPDSPERAQQEINLRMLLGVSLMATKGFAAAETEQVYAGGRKLFWLQGPSPELFHMLWSLYLYYQFSGEVQNSLEISHQLLELGKGLNDGALIMEAHRAVGATLVLVGRCSEALEHLEQAVKLYETHRNHRYNVFVGRDCGVMCDCFSALALWTLGYPNQSADRMVRGMARARELHHLQTLVAAGHFAVQVHQMRGEPSLAYDLAKEALELADEYGLELWLAYGTIEVGWAEAELGRSEQGIEQMQRGIAAYSATGAQLWLPWFLGVLADQLGKAGRAEEGLATIAQAINLAESSGERYSLAELHRIRGEMILEAGEPGPAGKLRSKAQSKFTEISATLRRAETCFAESLAVAKQQQAKSWELRAHINMSHLHERQGTPDRSPLAETYSWFKEGHETADLRRAKALL